MCIIGKWEKMNSPFTLGVPEIAGSGGTGNRAKKLENCICVKSRSLYLECGFVGMLKVF